MTNLSKWVTGGIPPDPDQVVLNRCCFREPGKSQCAVTDDVAPLAVAAAGGRLRVFCPEHLLRLERIHGGCV